MISGKTNIEFLEDMSEHIYNSNASEEKILLSYSKNEITHNINKNLNEIVGISEVVEINNNKIIKFSTKSLETKFMIFCEKYESPHPKFSIMVCCGYNNGYNKELSFYTNKNNDLIIKTKNVFNIPEEIFGESITFCRKNIFYSDTNVENIISFILESSIEILSF